MKKETDFTTDQHFCIAALAEFAKGKHHLPKVHTWGRGVCVNWFQGLSTFDYDNLTRLVLVAHKHAVRIEIGSSGPRMVRIIAHRRTHDTAGINERHPTLEDLAERMKTF